MKAIGFLALAVAIVILVLTLTGCAKEIEVQPSEESSIVMTEPELPEMSASAMEDGYVVEDDSTGDSFSLEAGVAAAENNSVAEADSADVPDDAVLTNNPVDNDPYGMYKVSEQWASELGGLYANIDGNFYSLSSVVPSSIIADYGVGHTVGPEGSDVNLEYAMLYLRDDESGVRESIPTLTRNAIVSSGDFPALQIHRDNPLLVFGKPSVEKLFFEKIDFVGYTIPACDSPDATLAYYPVVNNFLANNVDKDHIGVFNLDDSPVEDVRNLEHGKEYLYECYLGTEYREIKIKADSRCYRIDKDKKVELPMSITKFGYFTIDISGLESGFYTCPIHNSVFEIVD